VDLPCRERAQHAHNHQCREFRLDFRVTHPPRRVTIHRWVDAPMLSALPG
jgi:hypothetical protein